MPVIEFDENRQYSWRIFAEDLLAGRLDLSKLVERYNMQTAAGLDARLAVSKTLGEISFRKQGFSPRNRWTTDCKRFDAKNRDLGTHLRACLLLSRNHERVPEASSAAGRPRSSLCTQEAREEEMPLPGRRSL